MGKIVIFLVIQVSSDFLKCRCMTASKNKSSCGVVFSSDAKEAFHKQRPEL